MGAGTSPTEPKFFLFGKPRDLSTSSQPPIFTKFNHETYAVWTVMDCLIELGRFSKNGRSPIFRFYVSLFRIFDSDPIFTGAEIALGFCSQQRVLGSKLPTIQSAVPLDRKRCPADTRTIQHPPVMRLMRMRWALVHPVWHRARPTGGPARAFFVGGVCGVLAGGIDGSNRASSIAHCLITSSSVSDLHGGSLIN